VTGIFNKTKGETKVNLSWRAFEVKGSFNVSHDNQEFDLNDMKNDIEEHLPDFYNHFNEKMSGIGTVSTLNYTMFSKSLSSWQRTYDPTTNTTTFYYNASKYVLFYANGSISNSNYTLKIVYDPSSTITTPGYATASGDTIVISPTAPSNTLPLIIGAVVAVIIVVGALAFFLRKRK